MNKIRVMMVDDEPLIRKVVKMEMNSRAANVETGDLDASVVSRVEMVETFADGPALMAALGTTEVPDYLLVDMEFSGEPTGGLMIVRRVHERYPGVEPYLKRFRPWRDLDERARETLRTKARRVIIEG